MWVNVLDKRHPFIFLPNAIFVYPVTPKEVQEFYISSQINLSGEKVFRAKEK